MPALAAYIGEEAVRHLHQDAGAVTRVLLAAGGAAVLQVRQHFEPVRDDRGRLSSLQIDDESDAA